MFDTCSGISKVQHNQPEITKDEVQSAILLAHKCYDPAGLKYEVFKACVRYFSLFLKDKCISSLVRTSILKRNLTYSCFFFPLFHEHLFSPGLPRATRLLETSCLEKITVCVIEIMLVTLPLVQMNIARREVK